MNLSSPATLAALLMLASASAALGADPSPAELGKLAESPELHRIDLPFEDAPAPDLSRFVVMDDGVRLAVSLYFPDGFDPKASKAAAVFEDSIYGRRVDAGTTAIELYNEAGYVVVIGDARGFAASFGSQQGFNTPQQTADEAALIGWIASQPWSNGKVATIGHSVSAVFADSATSTGAPALGAAIIRASDFDEYAHNMFPGGAPNLGILALAKELMEWHAGADCHINLATCPQLGFMPVDDDPEFKILQEAMRDHQADLRSDVFASLVYRDDAMGGMSLGGSGAIARIEGIRSAGVPARLPASWLDGVTALGALTRYAMAPEVPMEVVIGATTHGGGISVDPFATTPFEPAHPNAAEQFAGDVDFVTRALSGEAIGRSIHYVVLGTDLWKSTDVWPPAGTTATLLNLAPSMLQPEPAAEATSTYQVDFTATSGKFNRWAAQRGGLVFYGNRQALPGNRMTFDAPIVPQDMELAGSAELCLVMSTDKVDGLVIATLEDVAPNGRVTYLTEGMLRLIHRKSVDAGCDATPGVERSFNKADGAPAVPGEMIAVEFELLPVAALIRKGHHLRLALTGADAGWFDGLTDTPATWTIAYGGAHGSRFSVPMRPWNAK